MHLQVHSFRGFLTGVARQIGVWPPGRLRRQQARASFSACAAGTPPPRMALGQVSLQLRTAPHRRTRPLPAIPGSASDSNADVTPILKDICISYTDTTPPTIISRSPAPGATDVAVSTTVTVGFSEPMLASTISTSSFRLRASGAPSDVPATVTYAGTTATLTPNAALAPATQYQVTVAGSVSDPEWQSNGKRCNLDLHHRRRYLYRCDLCGLRGRGL